MSLLPIAVVAISFFLLFRALGIKAKKDEDPRPFQDNHGLDTGRRSTAINVLTPFQPTPPRHHPCRVCGVPATKRCPRCKSVYYCSSDHTTWASRRHLHRDSIASDVAAPKYKRTGGRTNHIVYPTLRAAVHPRGRALRVSRTPKNTLEAFGPVTRSPSQRIYLASTQTRRELFKSQWPALGYVGVRRATPRPTAPPLDHALSIFFHEFGLLDNQRPNLCVEKLVGGAGRTYQKWVGDIMLFREEVHDRYCDAKEEDLAPAIEYFRDYGRL